MIELMQGGGQSAVYPFPGDQYLGQVASADFIDGTALANLTGFSNGLVISANNAIGWLKFKKQEGQTLYVSKRSLRYRLSWAQLNAANMIDGSKIIPIKGELFKVRLMGGAEKDPTDWAVGDTQSNPAIVAPSEWNRFIYRISNGNPGPGSQLASFTDAEIGIAGGATLGRMTICKEVLATNSGTVVARANSSLTNFNYVLKTDGAASSTQDHYGWRPVLEYVAPAPPPGEFPGSGPGPKTLTFGDELLGYFGEVTTAELITHAQLRTHLGVNWTLRADSGWFKFFHKGIVKYISKNTFATGVTWDQVYQAGAAYGTNDNGKYGSVNQRKPLSLARDGSTWTLVPHLITSVNTDPSTTGLLPAPDNEWYDLMMRVCAGTHANAGAWAQNTLAQVAMHVPHTVIETASSNASFHLIRGYPAIDSVTQWNAKSNATGYSQHIRLVLAVEGNPYVAPPPSVSEMGITDVDGKFYRRAHPVFTSAAAQDGYSVTQSSFYDMNYPGWKAFDNNPPASDLASAWLAEIPAMPQSLTVTFPTAKRLTGLALRSYNSGTLGGGITGFQVQTSDNGTTWATVYTAPTRAENITGFSYYLNAFDVTAKYARLVATSVPSGKIASVFELLFVEPGA